MQILSFRGAVTAAAMAFVGLFGTAPSPARAQVTAPVVVATLADPDGMANPAPAAPAPAASGRAWIAQGTAINPSAEPATAPADANPVVATHADSLVDLVGDMQIQTDLAPDLKCLAQAVYFEARGEPIEGQLAVAEVVINRAKSDLYPADYCGVVTQRAQFSFVHHGRMPAVNENSAAWQRAEAIAEIAHQNLWQSKAADALYFHATYVRPGWARQKVELAQIDTHIFYR